MRIEIIINHFEKFSEDKKKLLMLIVQYGLRIWLKKNFQPEFPCKLVIDLF